MRVEDGREHLQQRLLDQPIKRRRHPRQGVVVARWSLASGQLRLRVISSTNPYDQVVWGGKRWKKIG